MSSLATQRARTTITKYDVLLPLEEIAELIELPPDVFAVLVEHEMFPGPSEGNLWSRDRILARYQTVMRAQAVTGIIYVIGFGSYVKIGITGFASAKRRIRYMQSSCPEPLEVYGEFEGTLFDEMWLLGRFIKYRTVGEWFRREGDLARWIDEGCPGRDEAASP